MKIKKLLGWLLSILIMQMVIWGSFVLISELTTDKALALFLGILVLIASIIAYFVVENKFVKRFDINRVMFTFLALILWNIINYFIGNQVDDLVFKGILSKCEGGGWACGFSGIEYVIFMIIVASSSAVILVCEVVYGIYKMIKMKSVLKQPH